MEEKDTLMNPNISNHQRIKHHKNGKFQKNSRLSSSCHLLGGDDDELVDGHVVVLDPQEEV